MSKYKLKRHYGQKEKGNRLFKEVGHLFAPWDTSIFTSSRSVKFYADAEALDPKTPVFPSNLSAVLNWRLSTRYYVPGRDPALVAKLSTRLDIRVEGGRLY